MSAVDSILQRRREEAASANPLRGERVASKPTVALETVLEQIAETQRLLVEAQEQLATEQESAIKQRLEELDKQIRQLQQERDKLTGKQ